MLNLPSQLIARNGLEMRIFESLDEAQCGGIHGKLCLIPTHTSQNIQARQCLKTLLGSPSVTDMRMACIYSVLISTLPRVTRLEGNMYSVAHAPKGASIQCIRKATKSNRALPGVPKIGNTELFLPCSCSLMAAGDILAEPPFPCPGFTVQDPVLRTVVPVDWADIEHVPVPPSEQSESRPMTNISSMLAPMLSKLKTIDDDGMQLEDDSEVKPLRISPMGGPPV